MVWITGWGPACSPTGVWGVVSSVTDTIPHSMSTMVATISQPYSFQCSGWSGWGHPQGAGP
ncbi:hypothetical protein RAA17_02385 [Komagataeibacter rhaeticus]|nr:hypothetical protein [Komagataeibacter rhaeticus]